MNMFERVMTAACRALSLAHLESLHLSNIHDGIRPKTWVTLFGSLPKLRLVHLIESSVDTFPLALKYKQLNPAQRKSSSNKFENSPIYFPSLQILTMKDVSEFDCEHLRDSLMERCERGVKLQELHLVSYEDPYENDVKLLSEVVVDLTWKKGPPGDESVNNSDCDTSTDYSDGYDDDY